MEKATREKKKRGFDVKIDGLTKDAKSLTPINDMLTHKYLQYKRNRSRITWPP
jgi:hypothetical protein